MWPRLFVRYSTADRTTFRRWLLSFSARSRFLRPLMYPTRPWSRSLSRYSTNFPASSLPSAWKQWATAQSRSRTWNRSRMPTASGK